MKLCKQLLASLVQVLHVSVVMILQQKCLRHTQVGSSEALQIHVQHYTLADAQAEAQQKSAALDMLPAPASC